MEYLKAILLLTLATVTQAALIYSSSSTPYFGNPYYRPTKYLQPSAQQYPYQSTTNRLGSTSPRYTTSYSPISYRSSPYGTSYNNIPATPSLPVYGSHVEPQQACVQNEAPKIVSP